MTELEAEKLALYEDIKAILQELNLTSAQYEEATYNIAELLGL